MCRHMFASASDLCQDGRRKSSQCTVKEMLSITWNKIKEENDQIGREFCLICRHEIPGEEKFNHLLMKGNTKG